MKKNRKIYLNNTWKKISKIINKLGPHFFPLKSGNISIKEKDYVYCTPSGIEKGKLKGNLLSVVDFNNNLIYGFKQTSEINLHLEIYKNFSNINCVIHTHPFFCLVFSATNRELLISLFPEYYLKIKKVVYVRYVNPGTFELAQQVVDSVKKQVQKNNEVINRGVVLLRNHGLVVFSQDIQECIELTLYTEELAKLNYFTLLLEDKPNVIETSLLSKIQV